jgi:hypothetical protein
VIAWWLLLSLAHAAECADCHPIEAAQHADSVHATAFETPVFRATWDQHPLGWCIDCHLPDAEDQRAISDEPIDPARFYATDVGGGLSCETCHVRDGVVLTAGVPGLRARAAHDIQRDTTLGSDGCIRCHEFQFPVHTPARPFASGDVLAQSTGSEWRTSSAAKTQDCASCHLDSLGHAMPGEALLAGALTVEVSADRVVLQARDAAHAVPTGDPFRRLILELCADPECTELAGTLRFGQTFERDETSWVRTSDTRIPAATTGSTSLAERPIDVPFTAWRLWSVRAESRLRGRIEEHDYRRLLHAGTLSPGGSK